MTATDPPRHYTASAPLLVESSPSIGQQKSFWKRTKRWKLIAGMFFIVVIVIAITILLIVLLRKSSKNETDWETEFLEIPSASKAQENSFLFSSAAHVAGTEQNYEYALDIEQQFTDMNIQTNIINYSNIYLSFYNGSSLAQLNAHNTSEIVMQFDLSEKYMVEDPTSNTSLRHQSWLAYAASGDVSGYLVYVNYADINDFEVLINELKLYDVQSESLIAIARYGELFRGIKALNAANFGFKALIVFSDPGDYGYIKGNVFPNGPWLPSSGFQRGSSAFINRCFGNLSPNRSVEYCGRPYYELIPSIPIIPISYHNAYLLMSQMNSSSILDYNLTNEWQGGMNFTYNIGSANESHGVLVNVQVSNTFEPTSISNVIGFIPGVKYKNESILFASHRDAWVFGCADPISGTTSIIEIARSFSTLVEQGWQPLRNIYFGSWDAEEFGLIGSTEFGEKEQLFVKSELVAYFNQDVAVGGPNWEMNSDPLLEFLVKDAMKKVQQPYTTADDDTSVYDMWEKKRTENGLDLQTGMLGSGSDYTVFVHEFGIAAVDAGFDGERGTYHSIYDSYTVMSEFVDPDYKYARGAAQVMGLMGFQIANDDILPFNTTNLYVRLKQFATEDMEELAAEYGCVLFNNITDSLLEVIEEFGNAATEFSNAISNLDANDESYEEMVVSYNHGLRTLGTQFLYAEGLPTRPAFKNLIVAASLDNGYAAQVFPYIAYGIKFNCTTELLEDGYEVTGGAIENATKYLRSYL